MNVLPDKNKVAAGQVPLVLDHRGGFPETHTLKLFMSLKNKSLEIPAKSGGLLLAVV